MLWAVCFKTTIFVFVSVTQQIIVDASKPFEQESNAEKAKQMISWLTDGNPDTFNETDDQKIDDVLHYLHEMDKHRFIRLLKIKDLSLIKDYLTEKSWQDLLEFKEMNMFADVLCDECGEKCHVNAASESFQCEKCMLTFHTFCRKSHIIDTESDKSYEKFILCLNCFYSSKNKMKRGCQIFF